LTRFWLLSALFALAGCRQAAAESKPSERPSEHTVADERLDGRVVFVSERDGNREAYSLSLSDRSLERVTTNSGDDYPSPPSSGGKLAFIHADGSEQLRLLDGRLLLEAGHVRHPAWIDEQALVVESDRDGFRDLYRVTLDGIVERLTDERSGSFDPTVHGQRVVFVSSREGDAEIYSIDLKTRALRRLTWSRGVDMSPRLSPDGKRIAYVSHRQGVPRIYVMQSDGSRPHALGPLPDRVLEQAGPRWSPSGDAIAFIERKRGKATVRVVDANEGTPIGESGRRGVDQTPAWSPDGRHLVFASDRSGHQDLYVMRRDGTRLQRLTHHRAHDWLPRWVRH
jgi:TolB protein